MNDIHSFLQKIKIFLNYSKKDKKRNYSKKRSRYRIRKTTYIIVGSFFIVGMIAVSDTIDKITIQLNAEAAQNYIEQNQSPINVSAKIPNNLFLHQEIVSDVLRTNLISNTEKNTIQQDSNFNTVNQTFLLTGLFLGAASDELFYPSFIQQSILAQNEIQETIEVFSKEKEEIKTENSDKTQEIETKQNSEKQDVQKTGTESKEAEATKETKIKEAEITKKDSKEKETKKEVTEETKKKKTSEEQKQQVGQGSVLKKKYNADMDCSLSKSELAVLQRIVEAEAPEEDIYGKMLVANVVLNRVFTKEFPNTVEKVVFQKGQFSPIRDGRYWEVSISDSTVEAVNRVLAGEDYSDGALYFFARKWTSTKKASWFDNSLKKLFKYGGHEFYKNK